MALRVMFMSALIRKSDIAAHYPGGCIAFEGTHVLGIGDNDLYALVSMSSGELDESIEQLQAHGFDTEQFVAVADMCVGPLKQVPGIDFMSLEDQILPVWYATVHKKSSHG